MNIVPLVYTPSPFKGEGLLGFMLRTSEENGYGKPYDMLRYAGLTSDEMRSIKMPVRKLARLYGFDESILESASYVIDNTGRDAKLVKLNGHVLNIRYVNIKHSQICPSCVKEAGFIDMFFDMKIAAVCPFHQCYTINFCPKCRKKLTWMRPGLLMCNCGFEYSESVNTKVTNKAVLQFQLLIWNKFHGNKLGGELDELHGFPISDLEQMTFPTLIKLIDKLGYVVSKYDRDVKTFGQLEYLEVAASVFQDWPTGFYKYLHLIGNLDRYVSAECYGFRKQFERFHKAIFCSNLPSDELKFFRDEFINFGAREWGRAQLYRNFTNNDNSVSANVVGVNALAEKMRVHPATVRRLARNGAIKKIEIGGDKKRALYELSRNVPIRDNNNQGSMSAREAAKVIGIPVKVLDILRKKGIYIVKNLGVKTKSYHQYDVLELKNRILDIVDRINHSKDSNLVTLSSVMLKKTGGPYIKAKIIEKIINKEIRVYGARSSNKVGDLVLSWKDIDNIIRDYKIERTGGYLQADVASRIGCDYMVVKWLVNNGYLKQKGNRIPVRICEVSTIQFTLKYVFCVILAKDLKTSVGKIIDICKNIKVEIIYAKRGETGVRQPFIQTSDKMKIIKHYNNV